MPAPIARETAVRGANNVAGPTVTLTTVQTDYILLLAAYNENTGSAARTVTSVTSAGLTWALRRRSNASTTGGLEVWWAHGTGALSSYAITVNFSGTYDICGLGVVVVTGCASPTAPFDPNVSMPTAQSAPSAALWLPTFTGINTSSANDLLLFVTGSISGGGTPPTGFSQTVFQNSGAGAWGANVIINTHGVTALQTGATFATPAGAGLQNPFGAQSAGEAIFDALRADLPPPPVGGPIVTMIG